MEQRCGQGRAVAPALWPVGTDLIAVSLRSRHGSHAHLTILLKGIRARHAAQISDLAPESGEGLPEHESTVSDLCVSGCGIWGCVCVHVSVVCACLVWCVHEHHTDRYAQCV